MKHLPRRVLVADDDPGIREVLALNLQLEGVHVETAVDGADACRLAHLFDPELIVLDVMMPKMDGLDVLTALRADAATANIPVVLLTAKSTDEEIWAGWRAGADYYMTKPFDVDELMRFMERVKAEVDAR